jgi:hypothetical protein
MESTGNFHPFLGEGLGNDEVYLKGNHSYLLGVQRLWSPFCLDESGIVFI